MMSRESIIVPSAVPALSETPGSIRRLGPKLGEHTEGVLAAALGMSLVQIAELRGKRVI